jgi:hypothetical protein
MANSGKAFIGAAPFARSSQPQAAANLLERVLESGPRPAAEIARAAENAGIPPSALKQARADLGVLAEKRGFGADGQWMLSRGAAPEPESGGPNVGWALLAASAASFGMAYLCIEANRGAAERGGCPANGPSGLPAPPGAEQNDCCPRWFIVLLVLAGAILAFLGLGKL